MQFAVLITNMVIWNIDAPPVEKRKITDTLFQHEGLLTSIVQWWFWEEGYRPDITRELGIIKCTRIVKCGRDATSILVTNAAKYVGDVKWMLETIVTTSIVSKEYDPNCMVSYVAGMIRMMKATGDNDYFSVMITYYLILFLYYLLKLY